MVLEQFIFVKVLQLEPIFEEFECGVSAGCSIAGETLRLDRQGGNFAGSTNYVITLPNVGIANTYGQYYKGSEGYTFKTSITEFEIQGGDYEFIDSDGNSPTGFYKYHIFSSPGIATATAPSASASDLRVLMVGGGGAGGSGVNPSGYQGNNYYATGGGGAGGVIQFTGPTLNMNAGDWDIVVGSGGTSAYYINPSTGYSTPYNARQGQDTKLSDPVQSYTAFGGGFGGSLYTSAPNSVDVPPSFSDGYRGAPGASGGGGGGTGYGVPTWAPGGSGLPGQGNSGATMKNMNYTPSNTPVPGSQPIFTGGGGGGAGGAGQEAQGYPNGSPTNPNSLARHGRGGNGTPVPYFPSAALATRVTGVPGDTWTQMGPTNDYYAGGGAGGGARPIPTLTPAFNNIGGYGGGGRTADPWSAGFSQTGVLPPPGIPQDGAALLGGGGGGGMAHSNPPGIPVLDSARGGAGGPGSVMIRYVHPGAY